MYKSTLLIGAFLSLLTLAPLDPNAQAYGECSQYGSMAIYDSLRGTCKCITGYTFSDAIGGTRCVSKNTYCTDKYGFLATYNILTDRCGCMSGYVMADGILGTTCVSGSSKCRDQLGAHSNYDSYSGKCECDHGYVIQNGKCQDLDDICQQQLGFNSSFNTLYDKCECDYGYYIQNGECEQADDICYDKLGSHSSYSILSDKCECDSGYVLSQKSYSSGYECKSCTDKHGTHSDYNYLTKSCECDNGYTLDDDGQCIEKQNNVYFQIIEVDTDNDLAIIESEYDGSRYEVEYGYNCYDSTIRTYVGDRIVVNLGTDFSVDYYDRIVLQNDNEVCDILDVDYVSSSYTLQEEEYDDDDDEEENYYYPIEDYIFEHPDTPKSVSSPSDNSYCPSNSLINPLTDTCDCIEGFGKSLDKTRCVAIPKNAHYVDSPTDIWLCDAGYFESGNSCIKEISTDEGGLKTISDDVNTDTTSKKEQQSDIWGWIKGFFK